MRPIPTLTCSPRDTGHGSEVTSLLDHRPPPLPTLGTCFPAGVFSEVPIFHPQAPGTTPVGLGFDHRGNTRLRQRSEVLAGTKKGKNNSYKFFQRSSLCSRRPGRAAQTHGGFICPLPHSFFKASAVLYRSLHRKTRSLTG